MIYCLTWAVHDARTNLRTINRKYNLGKNVSLNWFMSGCFFIDIVTRDIYREMCPRTRPTISTKNNALPLLRNRGSYHIPVWSFVIYTYTIYGYKKDIWATVPQLPIIDACCRATCVVFFLKGAPTYVGMNLLYILQLWTAIGRIPSQPENLGYHFKNAGFPWGILFPISLCGKHFR